MKPQPKMRYAGAFAVLLALLAVLFVWNVNSGSLHLSVREVAQILLTHSSDNAVIVWEIRLPRIFALCAAHRAARAADAAAGCERRDDWLYLLSGDGFRHYLC